MKYTVSPMRLLVALASLFCITFSVANGKPETAVAAFALGTVAQALAIWRDGEPLNMLRACTPFDAMKTATESLADKLLRKASADSLWMNAIPKKEYKKGTGVVQTKFVIENSEPTSDTETWTDITLTDGQITLDDTEGTSNCDITYNQVNVGFTELTYGPRKFGLKGPVICSDNLTYQHDAHGFLIAYEQELRKRAKRSWEFEMRRQYMVFSEKYSDGNLVAASGTPISGVTAAEAPTSQLNPDMLDAVAAALSEQEAAQEPDKTGYVMMGESGPLYTLYIGVEASARILRLDYERRQDARWAFPNELWKRLGASRIISNFRHVVTTIPPRFDIVGGVMTQRPTFEMVATTQGYKAQRTAAWQNAEYEAAIVVLPMVFDAEVVAPDSGAGTAKFQPANYFGEWRFVTGAYRLGLDCDDPLDKLGQHFAEFQYAPAPSFPYVGKTIFFKRCPNDREYTYCS